MKLTEKARSDLEAYLREVRRTLMDDPDVDPDDVVEGIREHVAAALDGPGAEPATAEDLADVLERLGAPARWGSNVDPGTPGPSGAEVGPARRLHRRVGWELMPLVLAGLGGAFLLTELAVPLGWGLLVGGAVTARFVIATRPRGGPEDSPLEGLTSLLWHLTAVTLATVLVLVPAVLVWGQSQTGGALEPFLLDHTLPSGGTSEGPGRPDGYWPLVGLLAGTASGAWWILLGLSGRAWHDRIRHALGPARYVASLSLRRGLLWAGGLLFVLSVFLLAGSLG